MRKQEEIREIPGYNGQYYVTYQGRVLSMPNRHHRYIKYLKPGYDVHGYSFVNLWVNGKPKPVHIHSLVMQAFKMDEWFEGAEIDHINRNRTDNRVNNLRWVTHSINQHNRTDNYWKEWND